MYDHLLQTDKNYQKYMTASYKQITIHKCITEEQFTCRSGSVATTLVTCPSGRNSLTDTSAEAGLKTGGWSITIWTVILQSLCFSLVPRWSDARTVIYRRIVMENYYDNNLCNHK